MPTETNKEKPVQVPAQKPVEAVKTPLPEVKPVAPEPPVKVELPEDTDKYRGVGGDYIVNEKGHRVPLK